MVPDAQVMFTSSSDVCVADADVVVEVELGECVVAEALRLSLRLLALESTLCTRILYSYLDFSAAMAPPRPPNTAPTQIRNATTNKIQNFCFDIPNICSAFLSSFLFETLSHRSLKTGFFGAGRSGRSSSRISQYTTSRPQSSGMTSGRSDIVPAKRRSVRVPLIHIGSFTTSRYVQDRNRMLSCRYSLV